MKSHYPIIILLSMLIAACAPIQPASNPLPTKLSTSRFSTETKKPAVTPTQLSYTETLQSTPTPIPTYTPSSYPTNHQIQAPFPSSTPLIRTTTVMKNGLNWTECLIPNHDYAMERDDMQLLSSCVPPPESNNAEDAQMRADRIESQDSFVDYKITIAGNLYETKLADKNKEGCCNYHYELLKNGYVILNLTLEMRIKRRKALEP